MLIASQCYRVLLLSIGSIVKVFTFPLSSVHGFGILSTQLQIDHFLVCIQALFTLNEIWLVTDVATDII